MSHVADELGSALEPVIANLLAGKGKSETISGLTLAYTPPVNGRCRLCLSKENEYPSRLEADAVLKQLQTIYARDHFCIERLNQDKEWRKGNEKRGTPNRGLWIMTWEVAQQLLLL